MRYNYNKDAFSDLTDEHTVYFLGLLYADGNITDKNAVQIELIDLELIKKFKCYMQTDKPIYHRTRNNTITESHAFTFSNQIIGRRLNDLGIVPRKSLILSFPDIPEKSVSHFIRGYFDGDGCISIIEGKTTKRLRFCLIGTLDMLSKIQEILICKLGINKTKLIQKNLNVYELHIKKQYDVKLIRNFLYQNSSVFLSRKKEIFYLNTNIKFNSTSKYKYVCQRDKDNWRITYYEEGKRKEKSGFKTEELAYQALLKIKNNGGVTPQLI